MKRKNDDGSGLQFGPEPKLVWHAQHTGKRGTAAATEDTALPLPPGEDLSDQDHADTAHDMPFKVWSGSSWVTSDPTRAKRMVRQRKD